jgi:hypothetical protein
MVIEILCKDTDDTGVSDEIGGVECRISVRLDSQDSIQNPSNYTT